MVGAVTIPLRIADTKGMGQYPIGIARNAGLNMRYGLAMRKQMSRRKPDAECRVLRLVEPKKSVVDILRNWSGTATVLDALITILVVVNLAVAIAWIALCVM